MPSLVATGSRDVVKPPSPALDAAADSATGVERVIKVKRDQSSFYAAFAAQLSPKHWLKAKQDEEKENAEKNNSHS